MSKPLLVGITGGIGSGKSVVAKIFESLGTPVYNADARAKWLMTHSENLISAIKVLFGDFGFHLSGMGNVCRLKKHQFDMIPVGF